MFVAKSCIKIRINKFMVFLDKVTLMKKIGSVQKQRGLRMERQTEQVKIQFVLTPIYVALFFKNIMRDPGAQDELHAFAIASEQELNNISRMLVFWWFYAIDRIVGNPLLSDINVRRGLRDIWDFSENQLEELINNTDAIPKEKVAMFPWRYICQTLNRDSLSFLAINGNLHNAQMRVLRDPEEAMRG